MRNTVAIAGLLLVSLLLGGSVLRAQEALPKTHEGLIKELIASITQLETLLAGVNDEAGVAAAKDKMQAIMVRQHQLGMAIKAAPKPSAEEEAKLENLYKKNMEDAMKKLAAQYQRLAGVKGFKEAVADIKSKVQQ